MPSLSETQAGFARAVLETRAAVPDSVKSHLRAQPERRFGVYRNNVYVANIDVLQEHFPVLTRLVGEEFFRATARAFVESNPPTSPVLMNYGAGFADFLETFEPVADLPYLPDVARLEWAWNEAYHAADAQPLDAAALRDVPPDDAGSLIFELHPSVRLVSSRYPVVTIWSANSGEGEPEPIDAGAGGEDGLIVRPGLEVEVRRLPPGGAAFIAALQDGQTLAAAANAAAEVAPAFDLQVNLTGVMRSGAITALQPGGKTGA